MQIKYETTYFFFEDEEITCDVEDKFPPFLKEFIWELLWVSSSSDSLLEEELEDAVEYPSDWAKEASWVLVVLLRLQGENMFPAVLWLEDKFTLLLCKEFTDEFGWLDEDKVLQDVRLGEDKALPMIRLGDDTLLDARFGEDWMAFEDLLKLLLGEIEELINCPPWCFFDFLLLLWWLCEELEVIEDILPKFEFLLIIEVLESNEEEIVEGWTGGTALFAWYWALFTTSSRVIPWVSNSASFCKLPNKVF